MKKEILTSLVSISLASAAFAGGSWTRNSVEKDNIDTPKESKQYLATNSWDECVRLFDQGPVQKNVFCFSTVSYAICNISNVQVATNYWNGDFYFRADKCSKDHISDYPKESSSVNGIQWVKEYDQTSVIDGVTNTITWIRHCFPHKKITTSTKVEVKLITTVTTNEVSSQDTKCKTCGKR